MQDNQALTVSRSQLLDGMRPFCLKPVILAVAVDVRLDDPPAGRRTVHVDQALPREAVGRIGQLADRPVLGRQVDLSRRDGPDVVLVRLEPGQDREPRRQEAFGIPAFVLLEQRGRHAQVLNLVVELVLPDLQDPLIRLIKCIGVVEIALVVLMEQEPLETGLRDRVRFLNRLCA